MRMSRNQMFMLSGFDDDLDLKKSLITCLEGLGAHFIDDQNYHKEATHLIMKDFSKFGEKFLAFCASGKWILVPNFITDSWSAHKWLQEEDYEWGLKWKQLSSLPFNDSLRDTLMTPRKCRLFVADTKRKVLSEWKVALFVADKEKLRRCAAVLLAGNARIYKMTVEYNKLSQKMAKEKQLTHIFTDNNNIRKFGKDIVVSAPRYIFDFIIKSNPLPLPKYFYERTGPNTISFFKINSIKENTNDSQSFDLSTSQANDSDSSCSKRLISSNETKSDTNSGTHLIKNCFVNLGQRVECIEVLPDENQIEDEPDYSQAKYSQMTETYDCNHPLFKEYDNDDMDTDNTNNEKDAKKAKKRKINSNVDERIDVDVDAASSVRKLRSNDKRDANGFNQTSSQSSQCIEQLGSFTYWPVPNCEKIVSVEKIHKGVDYLLKPLIGEDNWNLLLTMLNEYLFAFRKPSSHAVELVHRVLAHNNWSDLHHLNEKDLLYAQNLHIQFVTSFLRDIALSCYTNDEMIEMLSRSDDSNSWAFISNLIKTAVNEPYNLVAFQNVSLVIDLLKREYEQFLRTSENYYFDIRGKGGMDCIPLITRLTYSHLKSNIEELASDLRKVINNKDLNEDLMVELCSLFQLMAETQRLINKNIRPMLSFSFSKSDASNVLYKSISNVLDNLNAVNLFNSLSSLSWFKLHLCAHIVLNHFNIREKISYDEIQISLQMICCLMTGEIEKYKHSMVNQINDQIISYSTPSKVFSSQSSPRKQSVDPKNIKVTKTSSKSWSAKNRAGETILHKLCISGNHIKLREILHVPLIQFGPDPNEADYSGFTPLCEAALHGHANCIQELIEWEKRFGKRLDYEASSHVDRQTALHDAIQKNHVECAKLIIKSGGTHLLGICRADGKTPQDLVSSQKMENMIKMCLKNSSSTKYKIEFSCEEEAALIVMTLIELLSAYIETSHIHIFIETPQESWKQKFEEVFCRQPNDTDIKLLIDDKNTINEMPNALNQLKQSLSHFSSLNNMLKQLEIIINFLTEYNSLN